MKAPRRYPGLCSAAELAAYVDEVGFLPLLGSDNDGWSAEASVGEDYGYVTLPDGGWEWPLWEWKGGVIQESGCAYGKFFRGKAGFVSREWWPDFCQWRRHCRPLPEGDSIEEAILFTLAEQGEMITRDLRAACGFTGTKMRSLFDRYVTSLQMSCRIVTRDFVYPHDRHGQPYGWGWSLLTTPEALFGREACSADRSPEESLERLLTHFHWLLPHADKAALLKLLSI